MATEFKLQYTGSEINQKLGKIDAIEAEVEQLSQKKAVLEPAEGDIPKVFLTGDAFGDMTTSKNEVKMMMEYISKSDRFTSGIKIKFQGSSSLSWDKKNFTIKMYTDDTYENKLKKSFKDWNHNGNKYVLKANYIDHSHARNIVSANLWSDVVASRPDYDSLPEELKNSPRHGAIDGFPIKLYVNGTYQGVYTWNIGKDDWMWGMDEDNANHILLCGEVNTDGIYRETACNFRSLWSGKDGDNWSLEVGTNSTAVKTSLNNLIQFVIDNDGDDFRNGIGQYLDIQSAIDYYIFQYEICGLDGLAKNMLLATYDGTVWRCGAYDMDSTFGLWWNGNYFVSPKYACPEDYQEEFSLLWRRIEYNYCTELKARQSELRRTVLSYANVTTEFERFMDVIGHDLYTEDLTIYTGIPSGSTNNIKQIRNFIRDRQAYVDAEFASMTPPIACTGITLDKSSLSFTTNDTQTIIATIEPNGCSDPVVWASSNLNIVNIDVSGLTCTVEPVDNGEATIIVTCGDYSASCSVTVSGITKEIRLVYELPQETVYDGTNYTDTNIALRNYDAYTVLFDFTVDESNYTDENQDTFISNYDNSGGWRIRQHSDVWGTEISGLSESTVITGYLTPDSHLTRHKFAIVKQGDVLRVYSKAYPDGRDVSSCVSGNIDSATGNVLIGCGELSNGKRWYSKSTAHSCEIYNGALDEAEINEFMYSSGSDKLLYKLPQETTYDGTNFTNTGVVPYNLNEYTILFDFTVNGYNGNAPYWNALLSSTGGYGANDGGFEIYYSNSNTLHLDVCGQGFMDFPDDNIDYASLLGTRKRIALVKYGNGNLVIYSSKYPSGHTLEGYQDHRNIQPLLIGASKYQGRIDEHSLSTVHDCKVYNRVVSEAEIADFMTGKLHLTWKSGYSYYGENGELFSDAGRDCTEKFSLQDCLYNFEYGTDTYPVLSIWDKNGVYLGAIESYTDYVIGNPEYQYAFSCVSDGFDVSQVSITPVDNSATMGDMVSINLAEATFEVWYGSIRTNITNAMGLGTVTLDTLTQKINSVDCMTVLNNEEPWYTGNYKPSELVWYIYPSGNNVYLHTEKFGTDIEAAKAYFTANNSTFLVINSGAPLYPLSNGTHTFTAHEHDIVLTVSNGNEVAVEFGGEFTQGLNTNINISDCSTNTASANDGWGNGGNRNEKFALKAGDVIHTEVTSNLDEVWGLKAYKSGGTSSIELIPFVRNGLSAESTITLGEDVSIASIVLMTTHVASNMLSDRTMRLSIKIYVNGIRYV